VQTVNATESRPMSKTYPVETQTPPKQVPVSMMHKNAAPTHAENPQLASAKSAGGANATPQKYSTASPKFDSNSKQAALARQQVMAMPSKSYGVDAVSGMPKTGGNSPPSASRSFTGSSKVNKVGIHFSGPKVGTSPHFIEYSVDMPTDKLEGADFLWMD